MERITPPADRHNTTGEIDLPIHGTNGMTHLLHEVLAYSPGMRHPLHPLSGPVGMSLPGQLLPTDQRTIDTSQQLSDEFPFNVDYNSGHTIGIGQYYLVQNDVLVPLILFFYVR